MASETKDLSDVKYTEEEVSYRDGGLTLNKLAKQEKTETDAAALKSIAEKKKLYTKDTWIVIHGMVYDVTNFLNSHPGGPESILQRAGKNATEEFEDTFHSASARESLRPMLIGRLVSYDGPKDTVYKMASGASGSSNIAVTLVPLLIAIIAVAYYFLFANK